jgi:arginyl-tRNA synthetase
LRAGELLAPIEAERQLYLVLGALPSAVERAYVQRAPHVLCEYAFELCRELNRFYHELPVIQEPDPARLASRLAVVSASLGAVELLTDLIGLKIPDRM